MAATKYKVGDAWVEFSDTACLFFGFDPPWSAFQHNSYVARVTFPGGHMVYVALPEDAASGRNPQAWTSRAVAAAQKAATRVVFL